ncbi:hypothetical protein Tco_0457927 [Tanacetum coccineum]
MNDPANAVPAITTLLTHASAKEPLGTSAGGPPGAGEGPAEGPGERTVGASDEGDGDGPDVGDGVGEAGVGAGALTGAGDGVGVGETVGAATDDHLPLTRASVLVNGSPTSVFSIKQVSSNLIHGINLGSPDLTVSHLFYADDVIITTERNPDDLDNIIFVFHVLYLTSGLKTNINKSNIYGIGVSDDEVSNMARNSGYAAGSFHFTYLGLPIGSTMNRGLNIGSLKSFNLALLQKWRWRWFSFPNALWVKVIKVIHEQEGGFDTYGCKFNGIWVRIVGSSIFLHSNNIIPLNYFRFKAGCGACIRFWKDIWIDDSPLNIRYNRLYRLELDKDCLIIDQIKNGQ